MAPSAASSVALRPSHSLSPCPSLVPSSGHSTVAASAVSCCSAVLSTSCPCLFWVLRPSLPSLHYPWQCRFRRSTTPLVWGVGMFRAEPARLVRSARSLTSYTTSGWTLPLDQLPTARESEERRSRARTTLAAALPCEWREEQPLSERTATSSEKKSYSYSEHTNNSQVSPIHAH